MEIPKIAFSLGICFDLLMESKASQEAKIKRQELPARIFAGGAFALIATVLIGIYIMIALIAPGFLAMVLNLSGKN